MSAGKDYEDEALEMMQEYSYWQNHWRTDQLAEEKYIQ